MKERPILFSSPMVRALLAGTKTQTRRVMGNQPTEAPTVGAFQVGKGRSYRKDLPRKVVATWGEQCCVCPYGVAGDRLWVRETWADTMGEPPTAVYRADGERHPSSQLKWRPAIHMPRWACRLVLEVTGVRVERLQDISEADAKAEGVDNIRAKVPTHRDAYRYLWDDINGFGAWDKNPWVWVVEVRASKRDAK